MFSQLIVLCCCVFCEHVADGCASTSRCLNPTTNRFLIYRNCAVQLEKEIVQMAKKTVKPCQLAGIGKHWGKTSIPSLCVPYCCRRPTWRKWPKKKPKEGATTLKTCENSGPLTTDARILHRKPYSRYVVFIIHVGGTRCVPSSTGNIMKIHARITLTVEFIRGYIFIFLFYVWIQRRVWSRLTFFRFYWFSGRGSNRVLPLPIRGKSRHARVVGH